MSVSSRIRMQVVRSVAPEAEGSASTSTASTSAKLGSHTTGVADSGRWSTRRIAMYALFVALAMVTSFIEFPITPVTWLKYDPSGIVCLIAGFAYGPAAAAIVSVLGFVPHMFANPWGRGGAGEQPDCHADLRAHDLPSCGRDDSADSAAVQRG